MVEVLLGDVNHEPQVGQDQRVAGVIDVPLVFTRALERGLHLRVVMLAGVAGHLGVEGDQIVERPLASALGALEVSFEHVLLDVDGKAKSQLRKTLSRFLKLAGEFDFLGLVDQRRSAHLAEVDREDRRGRAIGVDGGLVLPLAAGGPLRFGDLRPDGVSLRLDCGIEFDGFF